MDNPFDLPFDLPADDSLPTIEAPEPEPEPIPEKSSPLSIDSIPIDDLLVSPTQPFPAFTPTTVAEEPDTSDTEPPPESAAPKRRGRPKGSRNASKVPLPDDSPIHSALRSRTDKQLSERAQMILIGTSKIPALFISPAEMQPQEAQAIADPLVSYVKDHVDDKNIEAFVEKWDLAAIAIATIAYGTRVYKETNEQRSQRLPSVLRPGVGVNPPLPVQPEPQRSESASPANAPGPILPSYPVSEPALGADGL